MSATKEVLRYRQALRVGFEQVRESGLLTNNHILLIQEEFERSNIGYKKLPGKSLKNSHVAMVYSPPQDPNEIIELKRRLENYINDSEISSLDP